MKLLARHIMREKIFVRGFMTIKDAANKIISTGQSGLPVVNDKMDVVGVITEVQVLEAMQRGMDLEISTVAQIMAISPKTADVNTSIDDLIEMIILGNHTLIPITNNQHYKGVVSRRTIMETYLSPYVDNFTSKERKGPFVCDR